MKKSAILSVILFICITGFAKTIGTDWVETNNGKIDCKHINLGITKATVVLEDGKTMDYNFNEINSFSKDGKQFKKLMLYEDNKPTNQMVFMELKKTWNDLSLYKLSFNGMDPSSSSNRYYLYKGTNYHLQLDERSLKNTCKQFDLDYSSL